MRIFLFLICALTSWTLESGTRAETEPQVQGSNEVAEVVRPESGVRISPEFLLAFPQPLALGAEVRLVPDSRWRIYLNGGYFSLPISGGAGHLKEESLQGGVRYFPGNSWFFGLAGLGYRYLGFTEDVSAFKIDEEVVATGGVVGMHTLFARLGVGGQFRISRRIMMGMDIGYQLPFLAAARMVLVDSNTGRSSNDSSLLAVNSGGFIRIARLGLPEITLMRLTVQLD